MSALEEIRNKIAEAIKLSGMTQTALAKRLGINQATIAHYVRGDKLPALDTLANLCLILDLDANDILCLANGEKPNPYDDKYLC